MPNNSATGGALLPSSSPPYGLALYNLLQAWIVGIVDLPGNLVRVYDQAEPPLIPDAGTAWAAVKVTIGDFDTFPFVGHTPGGDQLQRHERIDMLASFYDLGSGGLAQNNCALLRDGLAIAQNREFLQLNAMGLVSCQAATTVPVLFKQRWMYRVDLPFALRRQVTRLYPVLDILVADIALDADTETGTIERSITVDAPP